MAWVRDLQHNPDLLSPAQAALVARVDAAGLGRQRVVDGELFYWDEAPATSSSASSLEEAERTLAALAERPATVGDLEAALTDYVAVVRAYVEIVRPAIRAALAALSEAPAEVRGEESRLLAGVGVESCRRDQSLWELGQHPSAERLAQHQAAFGMYAPAWDVGVACDAERPDRVLAMAALWQPRMAPERRRQQACDDAAEALAVLPAAARSPVLLARRALALADADDAIFFAAQQRARAAYLASGRHAELILPQRPLPSSKGQPLSSLRGIGWGRAEGRVVIVEALDRLPTELPADAVLVLTAFLPSHSFLLAVARAVVVETGGLLSHAAIVAREYGVPHLVGCAGATRLPPGASVIVDGDAGRLVVRAGSTGAPAASPPPSSDDTP